MTRTAQTMLSIEEFVAWQQGLEERYERVDGIPVPMADPITMMTGANTQQGRITGNVLAALYDQLEGSPCWPATADVGLRTNVRSRRRADVHATCDQPSLASYTTREPRMVVEALSPSNPGPPWHRKIEGCRADEKLVHLLPVESERSHAPLIARSAANGTAFDVDGTAGTMVLPEIACRLHTADVYKGVSFAPQGTDAIAQG